jgi:hypothetical protein
MPEPGLFLKVCHGGRMAADTTILQGEVNQSPETNKLDVERLLAGLMASLLREQRDPAGAAPGAQLSVTASASSLAAATAPSGEVTA